LLKKPANPLVYYFIYIFLYVVFWVEKVHLFAKRWIIAASQKDIPMPAVAMNQPMQNQPTPKPLGEQQKQANEREDAKMAPVSKEAPADKA